MGSSLPSTRHPFRPYTVTASSLISTPSGRPSRSIVDAIVGEAARRRQLVESLVADRGRHRSPLTRANANALEQVVRRRVAERAGVLEDDRACGWPSRRARPIGRARTSPSTPRTADRDRLPKSRCASARLGAKRSRARGRAHRARCACGPWCGCPSRFVVVLAFVALRFFSVSLVAAMRVMEISSGTIGSIERAKAICTGPRTWPQLIAGAHDGAEGADVEEIVAHELPERLSFVVVLGVELRGLRGPSYRRGASRCRPPDASR